MQAEPTGFYAKDSRVYDEEGEFVALYASPFNAELAATRLNESGRAPIGRRGKRGERWRLERER